MTRSTTHHVAALALMVGLILTGVTGCSSGPDGPERSGTCDALQGAVQDAQRDVEVAIAYLSTEPTTARTELKSIHTALAEARAKVATDERDFITRADDAVIRLTRQATRSAAGKELDGAVVGGVRTDLLDVVKDVRAEC